MKLILSNFKNLLWGLPRWNDLKKNKKRNKNKEVKRKILPRTERMTKPVELLMGTKNYKLTLYRMPCRLSHAEHTMLSCPLEWLKAEPGLCYTHCGRLNGLRSRWVRLWADQDPILYLQRNAIFLVRDSASLRFDDRDVGGGYWPIVHIGIVPHSFCGHRGGLNRKMILVWLHITISR